MRPPTGCSTSRQETVISSGAALRPHSRAEWNWNYSRGRAPYFYFSFLSHSARRCLFTRRFLLTSAGKTLEPPPSLQIVLKQFPLLLLFRPNRTQACFLTGDSEVIKKKRNKTQVKTKTRLPVEVGRLPAWQLQQLWCRCYSLTIRYAERMNEFSPAH